MSDTNPKCPDYADFLSEAADLLQACQLDCATYHLDQPERFELRNLVAELKDEANEAWARYHAHNDKHPDKSQQADYGTKCPTGTDGYPDCVCSNGISDLAQDVEDVLNTLGFVTEWNDGVRVYRRTGGAS